MTLKETVQNIVFFRPQNQTPNGLHKTANGFKSLKGDRLLLYANNLNINPSSVYIGPSSC